MILKFYIIKVLPAYLIIFKNVLEPSSLLFVRLGNHFLHVDHPEPHNHLFLAFKTNNPIFTTNPCEKMSCPSSYNAGI